MHPRVILLVAACCVAFAPALAARSGGDVRVTFADGRVTVMADNATLQEILREWSRAGGSTFVNAEKIPAAERLTLRLENETELRALGVLLRSVAGYVVAPRAAGAGASSVGNVLIMPVSRVASYAQAPPEAPMPIPMPDQFRRMGGVRPDDDGPVRQEMPPPPRAVNAEDAPGPQMQFIPGLGIVTSSQPGVIIQNPPRPAGPPAVITPTQPRRGGGGG